jgi:succinyl-diaminopimelate desuccinylase
VWIFICYNKEIVKSANFPQKDIPLEEILTLTKNLIAIHSTENNKIDLEEAIALVQNEVRAFTIQTFSSNNKKSLLIQNTTRETKHFEIILNAHLDVVPGDTEQFVTYTKDGKLFGRGAFDMKGAAAVMVLLFKEIAHQIKYPLALQFLTDEELGGMDGTHYQITQGIRANFVISGECGSNFKIVHESKARLVVKLKANGKSSHSAYPWNGDNAILLIMQTIQSILHYYPSPKEEEYRTTVVVTHIDTKNHETSETAYNRTPAYCEALLDIRYVPDEKDIIVDKIKTLLPKNVTLEILHNTAPHQTDPHHQYIKQLTQICEDVLHKKVALIQQHGTSDIRHFAGVGNDGIEFGPIGAGQHQENEWVDIQSLADYYQILKKFLLSIK